MQFVVNCCLTLKRHRVGDVELLLPGCDLGGVNDDLRGQQSRRLDEHAVGVAGQLAGDVQERLLEVVVRPEERKRKKKDERQLLTQMPLMPLLVTDDAL